MKLKEKGNQESQKPELTHADRQGKAKMVDVGSKDKQARQAGAGGRIRMMPETIRVIRENQIRKGDVLTVAKIAGIQAAKNTPSLIPLCHAIQIDSVTVEFQFVESGIEATCHVSCEGKTGVEMEALSGVSLALLTIYDMCKAIDKHMVIENIRVIHKEKQDL